MSDKHAFNVEEVIEVIRDCVAYYDERAGRPLTGPFTGGMEGYAAPRVRKRDRCWGLGSGNVAERGGTPLSYPDEFSRMVSKAARAAAVTATCHT